MASAVSPERHETVALAWTKAAILDCLGQARQALERFAGETGDLSMMAFVVDNLHQVHGCLRMLELRHMIDVSELGLYRANMRELLLPTDAAYPTLESLNVFPSSKVAELTPLRQQSNRDVFHRALLVQPQHFLK